ncbi:MAG: cytochrome B [Gammaproteobacteria bacterium HGW-Gammaproteobacteria-3]|nr:MAG: cytochrome B [Gammaproteobacteria bacterium HGW-Gammaproteobacteria-3]
MKTTVDVWDLPVRLFHWTLVLALVAGYITARLGGSWIDWHGRIGLLILGLLIFRLVWGFTGSTHARFASFFPTWGRLSAYFKGQWQGIGHNPLGALSVLALLALLFSQVGTGLFANDDIAYEGHLFSLIDKTTSDRMTGWHSSIFDVLLLLVGLHIASIIYYRFIKKNDLVRPMLTGKKQVPQALSVPTASVGSTRFVVSLLLTVIVVWGVAEGASQFSPHANLQQTAQSAPSF